LAQATAGLLAGWVRGMSLLSPLALVAECHGMVLRELCCSASAHFAGLTVAARRMNREGKLTARTRRRLEAIDTCYAIMRHVTMASCESLVRDVRQELRAVDEAAQQEDGENYAAAHEQAQKRRKVWKPKGAEADGHGPRHEQLYEADGHVPHHDDRHDGHGPHPDQRLSEADGHGPHHEQPHEADGHRPHHEQLCEVDGHGPHHGGQGPHQQQLREADGRAPHQGQLHEADGHVPHHDDRHDGHGPHQDEKLHAADGHGPLHGQQHEADGQFEKDQWVIVGDRLASVIRIGYGSYAKEIRVLWPNERMGDWSAGSWVPMENVSRVKFPARFRTRCTLQTVSDPPIDLQSGMTGCLHRFDKDGDLVISLDALLGLHGVFLDEAKHLAFD